MRLVRKNFVLNYDMFFLSNMSFCDLKMRCEEFYKDYRQGTLVSVWKFFNKSVFSSIQELLIFRKYLSIVSSKTAILAFRVKICIYAKILIGD